MFTNAQLEELERERSINLSDATPLGQVMPWTFEDTDAVLWENRDNVTGITPARGVGEAYPVMDDSGVKRHAMTPGHFGETRVVDASRLVRGREVGTWGEAIDPYREASRMMFEIAQRELSLVNYTRGRLLSLGEVSVPDRNGTTRYTHNWNGYTSQLVTLAGNDVWTDLDDSYPLGSIRDAIHAKGIGSGHSFNRPEAMAISNPITWSYVWKNENPADVGGKRDPFGATITDMGTFKRYMVNQADLPMPVIDDSGYGRATDDVWQFNVPDGYVVIVGVHMAYGVKCGNYVGTRHDAAKGRATIYAEIDESPNPPKLPRVHRGHSGGPRLNFGRQVIVMKVY